MKLIASLTVVALAAGTAFVPAVAKDWSFGDGMSPERWSLENSDYALCDAGLAQSPIDLGTPNAKGSIQLDTSYGSAKGKLKIGAQKVQVDLPGGMGMTSGGTDFGLLQIHFHTPAEHAINGERHPMVAHFVHATEGGKLGVLGIMFTEGAANPALQSVIDAAPSGDGSDVELDVAAMVPNDTAVYRYMGSLTTPPCSEGVNWHVAKATMTASADQIAALTGLLGPSARSIQPLGNRLLVAPGDGS